MALLKSLTTGNFTAASTWALCTAVNEGSASTSNSVIASTTTYAYTSASTYSSTVNANATGVLLKIGGRASTTGTISVALADNAGTALAECTMNVTDIAGSSLPTSGSTSAYGHWIFFRFNTPVAITNGTFYRIGYKTSTAGSILVNRNSATAGVHACAIVTDVTQAPAATDRFIIVGDNNASATNPGTTAGTKGSTITVTMDNTNTTQFGDGLGTIVNIPYWSLYVGDNAVLSYGTAAATNYNLRIRGNVGIGAGGDSFKGTFNMGTIANPIPRGSTAQLEMDNAVAVNHVFQVQGGIFNAQGLSRSSGKEVDRCLLNSDATAGVTSLSVDTDTGWLNGDEVYIGQTTRVAGGGSEARTLNANAGPTGISISAGLTAAKEGNTNIRSAIILLTRNVTITAVSSTLQYYWSIIGSGSIVDCDWVRFRWYGTATTSKQGGYLEGVASNLSFNRCVFDNSYVALIWAVATGGASITNCTSAVSFLGVSSNAFGSGTSFDNFWAIQFSGGGMNIRDIFPMTGIRIVGSVGYGINFAASATLLTTPITLSNFVVHSCVSGIQGSIQQDNDMVTLSNFELQRNTTGYNISGTSTGVIVTGSRFWGNSSRNIYYVSATGSIIFRDSFFAAQSGNTTVTGLEYNTISLAPLIFENCQFGTGFTGAQNHTANDMFFASPGGGLVLLRNCILANSVEVGSILLNSTYVISENHDQIVGAKKIWYKRGLVTSDTTITRTGSRSMRLTPNSASFKLEYIFAKCAVNSGTTPTIGVYVRKSVVGDGTAYNGNQPRLIVRRNTLVGIASDTVIATATNAANGAWQLISGNLPTLTGSGIVEIELDCDGTAGWVNIDDFQAPAAVDTKSFANGDETLGIVSYGDNSTGGGGSPVTVGYAFVG